MEELERIRLSNLFKNDKVNMETVNGHIQVMNHMTENLYFEKVIKPKIPMIISI